MSQSCKSKRMSNFHEKPDDLHWKKELTTLRKAARILRDPETSSSWRSPLSSRSVAAASNLNYLSGTTGHSTRANQVGRHSEPSSSVPLKCESSQKQIFLHNWRHHSSKSSDCGTKLDGDKSCRQEIPIPESPGDSSSDAHREGSKSDSCTHDPIVLFRSREAKTEKPIRKTTRKSKRNSAAIRHRINRKYANSKLLDLPSISSGGPLSSIELSDDTENCNSEDLRALTHNLMRKSGYMSRSASPLLPKRGNHSYTSKLLKNAHKDDSSFSCTPASTSSYNRYIKKNASANESWDGTTTSFDGDDLERFDLSRRQGCGIPCWSKRTPKHKGCGSCYSPSLSASLRRRGSSILCGSQNMRPKHRSSASNKQKLTSKSAQDMPLLTTSHEGKGSSIDTGESDDELSTNFGEMDLEALSRLDGRRWSMSNGCQDGLELVAVTGADEGSSGHIRSLSLKYAPRFFDEIIGQNIVVQSLINAISRERIAPAYLFQGPRGTGKTSTARIFAAALNCEARQETKPCGSCRACNDFTSGKSVDLREVDATNKKGIDRVRYLLKSLSLAPSSYCSICKVFIVDECHLLPTKTWSAFMKFLEESPVHVVFIFITTDLDNLPRTVLSRCQKYLFNKIKDADIITRLKKLAAKENLDIESHALNLIAFNADGSLRDAETMLEQLSLLGKRITASLVNELVGVVSDERLLDLLELAMSSDTAETVKRARALMDSGVDPMALMSQLAGLIMDIIAGTNHLVDTKYHDSFLAGRNLTDAELERLKEALKLLLEAEKQLRLSSERSTWFTAALLQLGSVPSPDPTRSSNSKKHRSKTTEEDPSNNSWEVGSYKKKPDGRQTSRKSHSSSVSTSTDGDRHRSPWDHSLQLADSLRYVRRSACSQDVVDGASVTPCKEIMGENQVFSSISRAKLDDIWQRCIDRCHSKTLRQLLHAHGRLVAFSEVEGVLFAYIEFENVDIKTRAERFLSSIMNSIEAVVRRNVEVRLGLMTDIDAVISRAKPALPDSATMQNMKLSETIERDPKSEFNSSINDHLDMDPHREPPKRPKEGFSVSQGMSSQAVADLPNLSEGNSGTYGAKERNPMQRIQTIIDEQRLESAWLQATEKGTPQSLNRLKPERNQVLPQDGVYRQNQIASMISAEVSSRKWEDELNHELKATKSNDKRGQQKDQTDQKFDRHPMSPSLLHNRDYVGNFDKDNLGYESGTSARGCNGFLCWKIKHQNKVKVKPGTPVRLQKRRNLSLFGPCGKAKKTERRFKK